jgi:hypothetical protein
MADSPSAQPYFEPATNNTVPQDDNTNKPYIELETVSPTPTPVKPAATATSILFDKYDASPAPNLIDPAFPKSSELFQALCTQFGPHNVSPLPMWLAQASDRERVQWYKFGSNSYIYFLHKSPKYKETIQKLVDTSFCCFCCCYDKHINVKSPYGTALLDRSSSSWCEDLQCLIWCPCLYPCTFCYNGTSAYLFYPTDGVPLPTISRYCCWPLWGRFRRDFFTALQQSGIKTSDPTCPCLVATCCSPCVASQYDIILRYYQYKRVGINEWDMPPAYGTPFLQYSIAATSLLEMDNDNGFPNNFRPAALRESLRIKWPSYYPLGAFAEWIRPRQALDEHNRKWANVNRLTLPFPGYDLDCTAKAVAME